MQQHLGPDDRRDAFYDALKAFAKTLQIALEQPPLSGGHPRGHVKTHYAKDLKYFLNLRAAVKQRYAESVDYSDYEEQIANMVRRHIGVEDVRTIIEPVNIFQVDRFDEEIEGIEGERRQSRRHRLTGHKRSSPRKMEEDPVLYLKLSELIEAAIQAHREKRLSDADYLRRMRENLETSPQPRGRPRTRRGAAPGRGTGLLQRAQGCASRNKVQTDDLLTQLALGFESIINITQDYGTGTATRT